MALISRGGYGLTRILDAIPYKAVAKAIERGTEFVGLSDFTALQSALLAKTGAVSWQGPAVGEDFGAEDGADDIMEACFDDLLHGQGEGTGWRVPKRDAEALAGFRGLHGATLWGGNLCVLDEPAGHAVLSGDRQGRALPGRRERAPLPGRAHARPAAPCRRAGAPEGRALRPFHRRRARCRTTGASTCRRWSRGCATLIKAPVLTGLPFGHVPTKVLLPVGAKVEVAADGRDVFMVWGHRHAHSHPTERAQNKSRCTGSGFAGAECAQVVMR